MTSTAHAQTMELTEVAVQTSQGIMSGEVYQILGALIIILCAYIIYLHRLHEKRADKNREAAEKRDDKFTASTDKMSDVIAQLSRDINNRRP